MPFDGQLLHMQLLRAADVLKRQCSVVVRDQPLNTRLDGGQHLPDIRIGQQRFAEFQHQRLFGLFPVGKVTGNFGETEQLTICSAQRGDDHIGPEPGAVLAYPPTFVFESSLRGGYFKFVFRFSVFNHLLGIELGEVLADDLFRAISLNAFRPDIPGSHSSLRIEHENRIVFSAFHQ